jgi:predicted RNA binding protein YcfA (HicA-like mRNA interferase family)
MSIFPKVSGKNLIKALCKNGFSVKRQKGSHVFVENDNDPKIATTIPKSMHSLKTVTLTAIKNN